MLQIIKEIGVFVVIAQAVLYFVPGKTYEKYVKVIIGILMIAKMAEPIFSLAGEEGWEQLLLGGQTASKDLLRMTQEVMAQGDEGANGSYEEIYQGIGEEIKKKLSLNKVEGCNPKKAAIRLEQGEVFVCLTVAVHPLETEMSKEFLQNSYSEVLGIPPERIDILWDTEPYGK